MTWIQIIVLAVVQGITEFLPISSSGHLVLVPSMLGWADQGLVFDIAVHFGSLAAVCVYFRRDLASLVSGGMQLLGGSGGTEQARLTRAIAVGTVPAAIAGLLFASWIETHLRNPAVVMVALGAYALMLAAADRFGSRARKLSSVRLRDALVIGMAQALALVPGTSRAGVTITAALMLGFERHDAARFSFVLSVPVILLATIYKTGSLLLNGTQIAWATLAVAALISAVVAYLTIEFFMRFVNAIGLLPFAIYRLFLAGVIYYVAV